MTSPECNFCGRCHLCDLLHHSIDGYDGLADCFASFNLAIATIRAEAKAGKPLPTTGYFGSFIKDTSSS